MGKDYGSVGGASDWNIRQNIDTSSTSGCGKETCDVTTLSTASWRDIVQCYGRFCCERCTVYREGVAGYRFSKASWEWFLFVSLLWFRSFLCFPNSASFLVVKQKTVRTRQNVNCAVWGTELRYADRNVVFTKHASSASQLVWHVGQPSGLQLQTCPPPLPPHHRCHNSAGILKTIKTQKG